MPVLLWIYILMVAAAKILEAKVATSFDLSSLPCRPTCLVGLPALSACLPYRPACLVGMPALSASLPCRPPCLVGLPAFSACRPPCLVCLPALFWFCDWYLQLVIALAEADIFCKFNASSNLLFLQGSQANQRHFHERFRRHFNGHFVTTFTIKRRQCKYRLTTELLQN